MKCVLCGHADLTMLMQGEYFHCGVCDLRFMAPNHRLPGGEERSRYTLHQTAPADEGYQRFVAPLLEALRRLCVPGARGLDYGAGHQPVLAGYMREMGYHICLYDPFFWPSLEVLDERYDFVVACEVIEHFFDPADEFTRLHGLLKSGGTLVLNTHVYTPNIDFESWYYRRDPTHVSFYSARTFEWIRRYFSFASLDVGPRVVTMQTFVAD